ncbi:MAG TPA: NUDIX hydrolase [Actinospica sp.]|nr:NUDIX hydrolase [Actinospica sp.]
MGRSEFPALPEWSERIDAYIDGRLTPEPAGLAATVVLLRESAGGPSAAPEVYLLKRATTMSFAGGRYAFPGGRVDPRDSDAAVAWSGPSAEEWGERFGCSAAQARALVCAAAREMFEETGVLFAGPSPTSVVASTESEDWEAARRALETRTLSFSELLTRRSLVLRTDLLAPWSRWITPEFEPRRYDTAFFIAALPAGQEARDVSGEADTTVWTSAAQAIADHDAGKVAMLPPTITTLRQVSEHADAATVLAAAPARDLTPIIADVERRPDGGYWLVWPIDV